MQHIDTSALVLLLNSQAGVDDILKLHDSDAVVVDLLDEVLGFRFALLRAHSLI